MKTVRFTRIVEEIGTPEPYTLWLPPEKDSHLQAAIKAHRVMTLHQENTGHATDFGEIGFVPGVQGSFLLFPKSLKRYEGCRVVGVKYDLLKEPPVLADPPKPNAAAKRERAASRPEQKAEPEQKPIPEKAKPEPKPKPDQPKPPAQKFEPLRIFAPESAKEKPEPKAAEAPAREAGEGLKALTKEVRRALKKLEQGNSVAAYQILEKAISSR